MAVRHEKHQELNGGTYPLANGKTLKIGRARAFMELAEPKVSLDPSELSEGVTCLHGRISAIRKSGGITFIKIFDSTGSIQLIATKAVLEDYAKLPLLDLGDIIEVEGKDCRSKTGELSMLILTWKVLTKSRRPPPEKWIGITNVETKYRQRYLDLMSSEESRALFITRSHIIRGIREYMEGKGFLEVETSTLSTVASGANAKPFTTHHNALDTDLFLRIAPELSLKKLLVGGMDKVFELGRNYRNEGISTRHNPEFTMLEFYEAYGNFENLLAYTREMLCSLDNYLEHSQDVCKSIARDHIKKWRLERTFTLDHFVEMTMWSSIFCAAKKRGFYVSKSPFILEISDIENPELKKIDIKGMLNALEDTVLLGEKIFVLFEYLVEPFLSEDYTINNGEKILSVPVFITEYPSDICPLARRNDKNPEVCDRFELFVDGRELANAFQELNDPDEQAAKFQVQLDSSQKDPMGYDADYIEALEYGMPPAIGFGMGIDRLVMLMTNSQSIKDVILFPTLKRESND